MRRPARTNGSPMAGVRAGPQAQSASGRELDRSSPVTDARQSSGPLLGRVEVPRAADVLADRLRQGILSGQLRPGELLPPERKLVEQTGLGRASVREALRMLEVEDLIEARLGRYGGWLVRRPDEESVARSIDVFIRGPEAPLRITPRNA